MLQDMIFQKAVTFLPSLQIERENLFKATTPYKPLSFPPFYLSLMVNTSW